MCQPFIRHERGFPRLYAATWDIYDISMIVVRSFVQICLVVTVAIRKKLNVVTIICVAIIVYVMVSV